MNNLLKYPFPMINLTLHISEPDNYIARTIRTATDASEWLEPIRVSPTEQFVALHLNSKHEVTGVNRISEGTLSASLVHPREVFKAAILNNAHAILVAHNHPSGSQLTPSQEDLETTKQLISAAKILAIGILDHLIIGPNKRVYSIRENHSQLWD
jgi:DNA repair protein RadC